jgi:hypothetical protein
MYLRFYLNFKAFIINSFSEPEITFNLFYQLNGELKMK